MTPPPADADRPANAADEMRPAVRVLDYRAESPGPRRGWLRDAVNGFAGGVLLAGFAAMLAVAFLGNQDFDPPLGAMCAMIGPPAMVAAVSSVALTVSLLIRRWRVGRPQSPPRPPVAFLTGVAHVAVVATGWWVLRAVEAPPAPRNVAALCTWLAPLFVIPAVAPLWLLRRGR